MLSSASVYYRQWYGKNNNNNAGQTNIHAPAGVVAT